MTGARPRVVRAGVVSVVFVVVLGVGCSGSTGGGAAPDPVAVFERVDMCTVLTDEQLRSFGYRPEARTVVDDSGDVGCTWPGEPTSLGMYRSLDFTVQDTLDNRRNFLRVRENLIGGRRAVQAEVDDFGCNQRVDAGIGSVLIIVGADLSPGFDSCGQAAQLAELIEPQLPPVGS